MGLFHYLWSRTAASNATADSNVNWAEGMAPSAVNDSARAMMASAAGFRDDIAGAIVTGGTSTAYTVTSYQVFDSLANMSGQVIAFTPHATNGATVTLNVDGLGAKPLRQFPSIDLPAGVLVQGTPYVALYNNSDAVWYLQNSYVNPYSVPLLGGIDYWDTVAPNSAFIFPAGQAISRTTYAAAFARWGTTYGVGDGSTTFNVPDKTGRVSAMKESSATRLTSAGSGVTGSTMGSAGGSQNQTIAQGNLPNVNLSAASLTASTSINNGGNVHRGNTPGGAFAAGGTTVYRSADISADTITASTSIGGSVPLGGSGTALTTIPPLIVCNYIIRII